MTDIREKEPRIGTRKLHNRVAPTLKSEGLQIGRDALFDVLKERDMLVKPKKRYQKTTYSNHQYVVAPNRIKNISVNRPNQVFVSDITYITLFRGFAYLFIVTDLYSRKIVGYHLSRDLGHHSALLALDMALKNIDNPTGIIHHSDRGCQYCCHEFLNFLSDYEMIPSMTDESHCYQNAVAERVNGTLKIELELDATFQDFKHAYCATQNAIHVYNNIRTHWSLNLQTPNSVYCLVA